MSANAGGQKRRAPTRRIDGVLLLDKPQGLTSNAALQRVKRLYAAERAGHTGTLDPLATGLLPICLGEATKFGGELLEADKRYTATLKLGVTTTTGDAEGEVLEEKPVAVPQAQLHDVLARFRGPISQVPPMHSAIKQGGQPLYRLARQGQTVERAPRQVVILELNLLGFAPPQVILEVLCSKGTYIRTLAEDIGGLLGCGAHLTALRRTRIGSHGLDGSVSLEKLEALDKAGRDALLRPVDSLLAAWPEVVLDPDAARRFGNGMTVAVTGAPLGADGRGPARVYGDGASGRFFLGLATLDGGWLRPRRLVGGAAQETADTASDNPP
ncbi:MAG TPA: tRNA pseudouridine(55) synthase TruB [Burkholderiales bacterium]|nr:tRNA pseudouridine(55) synthase TruB [Burkholderiales bacterium]